MQTHYEINENDAPIHMHPVDTMEPLKDERRDLSEVLVRVVAWLITGGKLNHIAARNMILATALQIGQDSQSYQDIAVITGLTRSGVQLMAKEFEGQFGIKTYNSRNERNRSKCQKAQKSRQK